MPMLQTDRLYLRPPEYSDAPRMAALIGDFEVARNLSTVPYPYGLNDAYDFVTKVTGERVRGQGFAFCILYRDDEALLGACALHWRNDAFELGYWIGKPYWGMGIAGEAVAAVVSFAFDNIGTDRLVAGWFQDNPASGRVLEKLGFQPAGTSLYPSRARGGLVSGHRVTLTQDRFKAKKAA